jgi:hypothetical protein
MPFFYVALLTDRAIKIRWGSAGGLPLEESFRQVGCLHGRDRGRG